MEPQRTDVWYQKRMGKATASRYDCIMAKGRGGAEAKTRINYRAELVLERTTNTASEYYQSKEMVWGIENEPTARMYYTLITKNIVEECGLFEHEKIAAGASPDGLIGTDGTLEIKCPKSSTHIATLKRAGAEGATVRSIVPKEYYSQIQGQMWITGREWAHFVSFDPRLPFNARILIVYVPRDDEYIAELEQQVTSFLLSVDEEESFVKGFSLREWKYEQANATS